MGKRELFFVLLLAILPFVGWAQQQNRVSQHISIKQTDGDSIQYNLGRNYRSERFRPLIRDGKVVWSFELWDEFNGKWGFGEKFSFDNVNSIDFRSSMWDSNETRKALIEFYKAMDGDHWTRNDNWCSDKPINEWYGIYECDDPFFGGNDVDTYTFSLLLGNNNLTGKIPECIYKIGTLKSIYLDGDNIESNIPECLSKIYSLEDLKLRGKITGTIPQSIISLPYLKVLDVSNCQLDGSIPDYLSLLFDKTYVYNIKINGNNFSGTVPEAISNHEKFVDAWPNVIIQNGGMDLTDLKIPGLTFVANDVDGNSINIKEVYNKNKYTLLYYWAWWCPYSNAFNKKLIPAYYSLKDKGVEIIGLYDWKVEEAYDYIRENQVPWINIFRDEWELAHPASIFANKPVPLLTLVDNDGNIVFSTFMDEKGLPPDDDRKWKLFPYLEERLGPIVFDFYTSTDYSRDGEVTTLQTATIGQGVDLVFVGEGFTDKDIAEGNFDRRMNEAVSQFFAYEPYSSLRDRFNIYAVKAISPNAEFYGNATHAIDEDNAKALEYATKVTTLISNRPMHVNVIYNNANGGRSYCTMFGDDSYICYAMEGANDVLNHEAGGHGIGKLLDEYVEYPGEALPEEKKTELESQWTTLSWGANVDWRSDPVEVKWAKFINDPRYTDEQIGAYEGSYLYEYGAYRPTMNSMMRYNDMPFNAPSREEIYKRVMKESEGENWTYDYETFVTFDAAGHSQFVDALNTYAARQKRALNAKPAQRTAPPVFVKGTWRDALNKKESTKK